MKQLRFLMAAALAMSLTACSGGSAPAASSGSAKETPDTTPETTPEPTPEANAEFSPDQLSFEYGEEEVEGKTIVTVKITNNSKDRLVSTQLLYSPSAGHSAEEVYHNAAGEDAEFDENSYRNVCVNANEIIEPGETSHAYRIYLSYFGSEKTIYITPEAMDLLTLSNVDVNIPQEDHTLSSTKFAFITDLSKWDGRPDELVTLLWNTWNSEGNDWLPEISGKEYSLYVPEGADKYYIKVYGADEAFVNSYLETLCSSSPDLKVQENGTEYWSNGMKGTMCYVSDDDMTKDVMLILYEEIGYLYIIAGNSHN